MKKIILSMMALGCMLTSAQGCVTECEAWFDFNFAAHQAIGASVATVEISSLPAGLHSLTIRAQDGQGAWGRFAGEVSSMSFYNSRGDVNMDGFVSISDVTALNDYLLSFDESIVDLEAADTSADE